MTTFQMQSFCSVGAYPSDCLQCFDAVGWAGRRASGLQKLSGWVLAWLSVGARCRLAYGPADAIATDYLWLQ